MTHQSVVIHWFRQDLRLADNPALHAAAEAGQVLPIFILDTENPGEFSRGAASNWWLHNSLQSLQKSLGGKLRFYRGNPADILSALVKEFKVSSVFWNRCYEPWRIDRDKKIKQQLETDGVKAASFNGSLLWEPWKILKSDNTPYRVFTPFYRKGCLNAPAPRIPIPAPSDLQLAEIPIETLGSVSLEGLSLLTKIEWYKKFEGQWEIGESGAHRRFEEFIENGLSRYKSGRNIPSKPYVSRLSPYLHFGEISPHILWHRISSMQKDSNTDHFLSELGWREFSYSLLFHFPDIPRSNFQPKFDKFPWRNDPQLLEAWQKGMTGYPVVDAGMRELWQTGYMHNRVRMIVGSFLVKNLLLHWHHGERWFWDCLTDADLANNSASWQWIAGSGADAAPYFRIFNPVGQGEKFDTEGTYTKKYVPELEDLPPKYLFAPWEAPAEVLEKAGVKLGVTYPKPIIDLKPSREKALAAFATLKENPQ